MWRRIKKDQGSSFRTVGGNRKCKITQVVFYRKSGCLFGAELKKGEDRGHQKVTPETIMSTKADKTLKKNHSSCAA
jgi:hypothetical protein